jgi:hypothetical protein
VSGRGLDSRDLAQGPMAGFRERIMQLQVPIEKLRNHQLFKKTL